MGVEPLLLLGSVDAEISPSAPMAAVGVAVLQRLYRSSPPLLLPPTTRRYHSATSLSSVGRGCSSGCIEQQQHWGFRHQGG